MRGFSTRSVFNCLRSTFKHPAALCAAVRTIFYDELLPDNAQSVEHQPQHGLSSCELALLVDGFYSPANESPRELRCSGSNAVHWGMVINILMRADSSENHACWPLQNAEIFTLTYGSLVRQLLADLEDVEAVNKQLDIMWAMQHAPLTHQWYSVSPCLGPDDPHANFV